MLYNNNGIVHNETIFGLESTQLKFGRDSLNELGWEISKYNSKKVLLVSDPALQDFNVTQRILDLIKFSCVEVFAFAQSSSLEMRSLADRYVELGSVLNQIV